jgi:hypothetical protein
LSGLKHFKKWNSTIAGRLKVEATNISETSVTLYQLARCHTPEDFNFHQQRCNESNLELNYAREKTTAQRRTLPTADYI